MANEYRVTNIGVEAVVQVGTSPAAVTNIGVEAVVLPAAEIRVYSHGVQVLRSIAYTAAAGGQGAICTTIMQ